MLVPLSFRKRWQWGLLAKGICLRQPLHFSTTLLLHSRTSCTKPLSPGYCHTLQSTWLISTEETVRQSYKRLLPCIHEQDRSLVPEVSAGIHGRLPGEALEWIGEHR